MRAIDGVVAAAGAGGGGGGGSGGGGAASKGGRKGATGSGADVEAHAWEDKRYKMMLQLFNVFQLPLEKLWSLCIAEENFVK